MPVAECSSPAPDSWQLACSRAPRPGPVGCGELTLETPLLLPEQGGVRIQLVVGPTDESGVRPLGVYSRSDSDEPGEEWVRHAQGVLEADSGAAVTDSLLQWPVPGAEQVPMEGFYEGLAQVGYGYGPVFQGLESVWRLDGDVFAEVALPDSAAEDAGRFGLHPAVLDAALHAMEMGDFGGESGRVTLAVRLHRGDPVRGGRRTAAGCGCARRARTRSRCW
ncbi:hypothetical protein SANTM175S_03766 [Streptomyces antimycoticus]